MKRRSRHQDARPLPAFPEARHVAKNGESKPPCKCTFGYEASAPVIDSATRGDGGIILPRPPCARREPPLA